MWQNEIYGKLPVALQNVACSLEGLRIKRSRYNNDFWTHLRECEQNAQLDRVKFEAYRDARLRDFIEHAATTVPYYQKLFTKTGIQPADIRSLQDLAQLPVLKKSEIQNAPESFLSTAVPKVERKSEHTSGTTGAGLVFSTTQTAVREQYAVWWRYLRWHGLPFGTWCAYFGGRSIVPLEQTSPPFWRENRFGRQILFSALHTAPENIRFTAQKLREARPPWLHGYPSHLTLLASYLLESGFDLGYQPRWVTTCSESVLAHHRTTIRSAFGVEPLQHYAMAEAVANISECPEGNLHVDEDFSAVEFVPAGDDGLHRVIGTNMSNRAMPFLRYDTGDLVRLSSRPCGCGRPGRIVASIDGRAEDNVELPNGARICRLDHIFKDQMRVRAAQIRQRDVGSIDVLIIKNQGYTERDEADIIRNFTQRIGSDIAIRIHYVDKIEKTPAGKTRFIVSELLRNKLVKVMGSWLAVDSFLMETCCPIFAIVLA